MHDSVMSFLISQLLYAAPPLLVAAGGFFAAIAYSRRAPAAARLVMLGCVIYFFGSLGGSVASAALINAQDSGAFQARDISLWMGIMHGIQTLLSTLTYVLWLAAAFVGRPPTD